MSAPPVDLVVSRLKARGVGKRWTARCPAHDDHSPSLSIAEGDDGRVLLKCFAGCSVEAVVGAMGLTMADLYVQMSFPRKQKSASPQKKIVKTYDYRDEVGTLLYQVVRYQPKGFAQRRPKGTGWEWNMEGVRLVPYRLPQLIQDVARNATVFITEGEKDADAVCEVGAACTTSVGGAGKWRTDYVAHFQGADVVIVADADDVGRKHACTVYESLKPVADRCRIVEPYEGKDVSEHLASGHSLEELVPVEYDQFTEEVVSEPVDAESLGNGGETTSYVVRDIGKEWRNPTAGGVPTIGQKDDGTYLFYVGCVNGIHGGPGSGKSWLMAEVAKQELRLGRGVLWLDMEDSSERVIVERLKIIAVTEKQATDRFHYVNGGGDWPEKADIDRLCDLIKDKAITYVVIDSVGEMMATGGLEGNDDGDVATFLQDVARRLAAAGPAVVLLDHVTKAGDNKLWPTGSQRKLAGITGAAYLLETSRPFSKDESGSARLVCAKDRHGATGRNSEAAWIKFTPMPDGGLEIDIRASEKKTEAERAARSLEKHGRDVYELLEAADDGLGTNELQARTQLTRQKITAAVEWLVRLELVAVVDGPNRKKMHQVTAGVPPWRS